VRAVDPGATRRSITEDELIAAIVKALGAPPRTLRLGIGDDAAVWKASPHHLSLLTTDMLVDGVHFRLAATSPQALGRKALAENLSDIAAMGGWPTVAVVALGLTDVVDEAWVRGFYSGIASLAKDARCAIAGGDIVRAPAVTLGITVVGEVRPTHLRTRAGARPGDIAAITGPLGRAAAGLRLLDKPAAMQSRALERGSGSLGRDSSQDFAAVLRTAYLEPTARLREGRYLASRHAVRALMDIPDGLSTDATRMARASGVDVVLDPVALAPDPAVAAAARELELDAIDLVLNGGDDYELLAAIEPRAFEHVAAGFAKRFGRPLLRIGRFETGEGRAWIGRYGKRGVVTPSGYDHMKRMRGTD
jgi:thiamine-monophosphate kinase